MLYGLDIKLFYLINRTIQNHFFDFLMPIITKLGSGEAAFAIAVLIILFNLRKKANKAAGILLLAGLTPTYYAIEFLKKFVARPRPYNALTDVHLIGQAGGFSFPSGHATIAFMTAVILSHYFKRGRTIFYLLAVAVCVSRVYVGVHYVSDVAAGAIIGSAIGFVLVKIAKD